MITYQPRSLWTLGSGTEGDGEGILPGPDVPPPALVIAHNYTPKIKPPVGSFIVKRYIGGGCVRVSETGSAPMKRGGGARGEVKGFSASSRRRMSETLHSINRVMISGVFFANLTVPAGDQCTWPEIERYRRAWVMRLKRHYKGIRWFMVWKKEPHKSGLPHLHALIFFVDECPSLLKFRDWNDQAWAKVVKSSSPHHVRRGCTVNLLRDWEGVGVYCSKYMSKSSEHSVTETGRIWGVENRKLLKECVDVREHLLDHHAGVKLQRVLRKVQQVKRTRWLVKGESGWQRIRRQWDDGERGTVEAQLARLKLHGIAVKRIRPRCSRTLLVKVWNDVEDMGTGERYYERDTDEKRTITAALHMVNPEQVGGLIQWALNASADDRRRESALPF